MLVQSINMFTKRYISERSDSEALR